MQSSIELCSIINIRSGKCSENCAFCTQSAHHSTEIEEYESLDKDLILKEARALEKKGVRHFSLVASGRQLSEPLLSSVVEYAQLLRKETSLRICASLGFLTKETAAVIAQAGISRYHHNLEAGRSFFSSICTTHTFDERINTLKTAQEAGLELCSGGIIGLGESMENRIEMIMELKELGVRSIPINVLTAVTGTKTENLLPLTTVEITDTISQMKQVYPEAQIRFAGGRSQFPHDFMIDLLDAGVDALMTGNYLTTSGFDVDNDLALLSKKGLSVSSE